jgi:SAM-dependent methyltransferase
MPVNQYGDEKRLAGDGFGIDIASQRADDLDQAALAFIVDCGGDGVSALDVACGQGGQALRMAAAGASVTAVDLTAPTWPPELHQRVRFVTADMRAIERTVARLFERPVLFHVIVCQRAVHYLPYKDAVAVVQQFASLLAPEGRLFISASGLLSELGTDYSAAGVALPLRYAPLSGPMVEKHGIRGPVCLYTEDDMRQLLADAKLAALHIFSSPFGNVKAIATHDNT